MKKNLTNERKIIFHKIEKENNKIPRNEQKIMKMKWIRKKSKKYMKEEIKLVKEMEEMEE